MQGSADVGGHQIDRQSDAAGFRGDLQMLQGAFDGPVLARAQERRLGVRSKIGAQEPADGLFQLSEAGAGLAG
jgi:hypothetical protein